MTQTANEMTFKVRVPAPRFGRSKVYDYIANMAMVVGNSYGHITYRNSSDRRSDIIDLEIVAKGPSVALDHFRQKLLEQYPQGEVS